MIWPRLAIYGAAVAAIFLAGWHFGSGHVQTAWNVERLAQDTVLQAQLAKNAQVQASYIKQVHDAEVARDDTLKILADLRAKPSPHLVCHAAPDPGAVPGIPTSTAGETRPSGDGVPVRTGDFDPGPALTALHHHLDDELAECANALNLWPNSVPSSKGSIP